MEVGLSDMPSSIEHLIYKRIQVRDKAKMRCVARRFRHRRPVEPQEALMRILWAMMSIWVGINKLKVGFYGKPMFISSPEDRVYCLNASYGRKYIWRAREVLKRVDVEFQAMMRDIRLTDRSRMPKITVYFFNGNLDRYSRWTAFRMASPRYLAGQQGEFVLAPPHYTNGAAAGWLKSFI